MSDNEEQKPSDPMIPPPEVAFEIFKNVIRALTLTGYQAGWSAEKVVFEVDVMGSLIDTTYREAWAKALSSLTEQLRESLISERKS